MKTSATAAEKASWLKWLATYGADNFFDAFLRTAQGAISRCENCGEEIALDIVEGGGVPDWGARIQGIKGEPFGDYGCYRSPDTTSEGTGSHVPARV